jgi:hypothetical protein
MFMSKLLETTIDCDEGFCDEVVKRIMSPLVENTYRSIKASTDLGDASDEVASRHLKPTLNLIGDILQYFLDGTLFGTKDYRVVLIFLKNFHQEGRISNFINIVQWKCLVFDFGKIMFIMQFLEMHLQVVTNSVSAATLNASVCRIKNSFNSKLSKGSWTDFVEFCYFGQFYWKLIESKIPVVQIRKRNKFLSFSTQFIILLLMPQFCFAVRYCMSISDFEEELLRDEFRDVFILKVIQMLNQDSIRISYIWRDYFIARSDVFEIAKYAATVIKNSRRYYSREEAVVVFQAQIYNLKDIIGAIKDSPEILEFFLNKMDYFDLVFETVTLLISEFDITWRDGFEAIDVMAVAFDFLTMPHWSAQVVVQALKLINVATAKYMTPNLALLVDLTADSTTTFLGPLLYSKFLDEVVEVKKAALEVTCTMAKMSNSSKSISR